VAIVGKTPPPWLFTWAKTQGVVSRIVPAASSVLAAPPAALPATEAATAGAAAAAAAPPPSSASRAVAPMRGRPTDSQNTTNPSIRIAKERRKRARSTSKPVPMPNAMTTTSAANISFPQQFPLPGVPTSPSDDDSGTHSATDQAGAGADAIAANVQEFFQSSSDDDTLLTMRPYVGARDGVGASGEPPAAQPGAGAGKLQPVTASTCANCKKPAERECMGCNKIIYCAGCYDSIHSCGYLLSHTYIAYRGAPTPNTYASSLQSFQSLTDALAEGVSGTFKPIAEGVSGTFKAIRSAFRPRSSTDSPSLLESPSLNNPTVAGIAVTITDEGTGAGAGAAAGVSAAAIVGAGEGAGAGAAADTNLYDAYAGAAAAGAGVWAGSSNGGYASDDDFAPKKLRVAPRRNHPRAARAAAESNAAEIAAQACESIL